MVWSERLKSRIDCQEEQTLFDLDLKFPTQVITHHCESRSCLELLTRQDLKFAHLSPQVAALLLLKEGERLQELDPDPDPNLQVCRKPAHFLSVQCTPDLDSTSR